MLKGLFVIVVVAGLGVGTVVLAQRDPLPANNQVVSRDAIGLRVVPNPEHRSPLDWYNKNIKVKGSPQSLIVDGYEAVRDGRTVYVNAANVATVNRCVGAPSIICTSSNQCPTVIEPGGDTRLPNFLLPTAWAAPGGQCAPSPQRELYTNIYIISYNQNPEAATTDIFGQLLQFWKFNSDIKNCADDPGQFCTQDAECGNSEATAPGGGNGGICQPTGMCSVSDTKACLVDSDCPQSEFCRNKKSAVIRDVRRLADLQLMKDRLEAYNTIQKTYPVLAQGTYLAGRTISTWDSWNTTFKNALGTEVPTDPINRLAACGGRTGENYSAVTCWDEGLKKYGAAADPLALPGSGATASYAYLYQYQPVGNTFRFCGTTESGFVQGKAPGASLCQVNNCSCNNRQCGNDGCGKVCGTCRAGQTCQNFKCVISTPIEQ